MHASDPSFYITYQGNQARVVWKSCIYIYECLDNYACLFLALPQKGVYILYSIIKIITDKKIKTVIPVIILPAGECWNRFPSCFQLYMILQLLITMLQFIRISF